MDDYVSDIGGGMWGDSGSYSFNGSDFGFSVDNALTLGSVDPSAGLGDFNLSSMTFDGGNSDPSFGSSLSTDLSGYYDLTGFGSTSGASTGNSSGSWLDSFLNNKNALGLTAIGLNSLGGYLAASQAGAQAGSAAELQAAQIAQRQKEIDDQVKRSAWVSVSKENWRPVTQGGSQTGILAAAMNRQGQ